MSAVPAPDWAALYQKHREAMFRVAASVLRDRGIAHQAEDVVSIVFTSAMEKPPEDVLNWEAWLVLAAKRRALDMVKSAGVSRVGELTEEHDRVADDAADAMELMEWAEKVARARRVLSKMDEREQYVAARYMIADRPREEVAGQLGVTPGRISQIAGKIAAEIEAATKEGG